MVQSLHLPNGIVVLSTPQGCRASKVQPHRENQAYWDKHAIPALGLRQKDHEFKVNLRQSKFFVAKQIPRKGPSSEASEAQRLVHKH